MEVEAIVDGSLEDNWQEGGTHKHHHELQRQPE